MANGEEKGKRLSLEDIRSAPIGAAPASTLEGIRERRRARGARPEFEFFPGIIGDAFFMLDRPAAALRGAFLEPTFEGGSALTGFLRGLRGEDSYNLDTYYGRGLGTLGAQAFLDPLLFVGGPGFTASAKATTAAKIGRVTPEAVRAGEAALFRAFANPLKRESGVSISQAMERLGQMTGFTGLQRGSEGLRAFNASLASGTKGALDIAVGASVGRKAAFLRDAASSLITQTRYIPSQGPRRALRVFFDDIRHAKDTATAVTDVKSLVAEVLPELRATRQLADESEARLTRLVDEAVTDLEGADRSTVVRRFARAVEEIRSLPGDAKELKLVSLAGSQSPLDKATALAIRQLDQLLDAQAAAGVRSVRLGGDLVPTIRNLEKRLSRFEALKERLANFVEESRDIDDLMGRIQGGDFLTAKEMKAYRKHLQDVENLEVEALALQDEQISKIKADLAKARRASNITPSFLHHHTTEQGWDHLGLGRFPGKPRGSFSSRKLTLNDDSDVIRKLRVKSPALKKAILDRFGRNLDVGTPLSLEEANFAYREGLMKLTDDEIKLVKDPSRLSPADRGVPIDFDVFNMNGVKLVHSSLVNGGRRIAFANHLTGKVFPRWGTIAKDANHARVLERQGKRQLQIGFFHPGKNAYFDNDIANAIEDLSGIFFDEKNISAFGRALDFTTRFWKDWTLFSIHRVMGFSTRNWVTEMFFNYASGMRNPSTFGKHFIIAARALFDGDVSPGQAGRRLFGDSEADFMAAKVREINGERAFVRAGMFDDEPSVTRNIQGIARHFDETVGNDHYLLKEFKTADGRTVTMDELILNARKFGILQGGFSATEMKRAVAEDNVDYVRSTKPVKTFARRANATINPTSRDAVGKKIAAGMENHSRLMQYTHDVIERGMSFEDAAKRFAAFHIMPRPLSGIEAQAPRVFPFYRWLRFNLPTQIKLLAQEPSMFAIQGRLFEAVGRGVTIEENDLPSWVRARGNIPLRRTRDERTGREYYEYVTAGFTIPVADLIQISNGEMFYNTLVDNLNAPVKSIAEVVMDYNLSFRKRINDRDIAVMGGDYIVPDVGPFSGPSVAHVLQAWNVVRWADRTLLGFPTAEAEQAATKTRLQTAVGGLSPLIFQRTQVGRESLSQQFILQAQIAEIMSRVRKTLRSAQLTPEAKDKARRKAQEEIERVLTFEGQRSRPPLPFVR